jgi:hypothetical protein
MGTVLQLIAVIGAIAAAVTWVSNTIRHRRHLSRCVDLLQRHQRLERRLTGCVTEMEHILDRIPPQAPQDRTVPEELEGHVRFLFGLRREAADNAVNLARHTVRLHWSDAYLSKATLAGRRCELAHGALMSAFQAMADAAKEYERGLAMALLRSGDGEQPLTGPVRLLDEASAIEVARMREDCTRFLVRSADACRLRFESSATFDTTWPVRRSEVTNRHGDPYMGELRPLGWQGLGPQPMFHVDAK